MSVWSFALRNVARNRRRSLLAGAVVVCGFAAFALAGGFMAQSLTGLREGTIRNGLGHLQVAHRSVFDGGAEAPGYLGFDAVASQLQADPAVEELLPRVEFVGLLTDGQRSVAFLGTGLDPEAERRTMDAPRALAAGRWLETHDDAAVVLGGGLARALSVGVDDPVTLVVTTTDGVLNAVDAQVVGLVDIPLRELDERFLATPLGLAQRVLDVEGKLSKIAVVLHDGAQAAGVARRLEERLGAEGSDARVRTWDELATFYQQVRLLYFGIFGFMGLILVLVVLLASVNTMLMAASERTREIGTLRAIGTRPARIRRMFLAEGVIVGLAGSLVGAGLALAVRAILNRSGIVLPPPPGVTHGMPLHVEFHGVAYLVGAVAMILTMAIAAWVPARRASRMSIVEALAHV